MTGPLGLPPAAAPAVTDGVLAAPGGGSGAGAEATAAAAANAFTCSAAAATFEACSLAKRILAAALSFTGEGKAFLSGWDQAQRLSGSLS